MLLFKLYNLCLILGICICSSVLDMDVQYKSDEPITYSTAYGGKILWTMPFKQNQIVLHMKNKKLIRKGKRWSQVTINVCYSPSVHRLLFTNYIPRCICGYTGFGLVMPCPRRQALSLSL